MAAYEKLKNKDVIAISLTSQKTHIVFSCQERAIIEEINKYCCITGRSNSIEEASYWAVNAGGEDPDIFLINCAPYLQNCGLRGKVYSKRQFIKNLTKIKQGRISTRIILLIPKQDNIDFKFIDELLRLRIYDFWFLNDFNEDDLRDIIFTTRDTAAVEKYISLMCNNGINIKRKIPMELNTNKVFVPYFVKSSVLVFWSNFNQVINYGMALLNAVHLAEHGFKVALIEAVTPIPQLSGIASMTHPYFNTSHALSMFSQRNNSFYKECLFNWKKYKFDLNTEKEMVSRSYPDSLFFLPDGKRQDNIPLQEMKNNWQGFLLELVRELIFKQEFQFVIFVAQGINYFNEIIFQEIAYKKIITLDMLPGSIAYVMDMMRDRESNILIAVDGVKSIRKQADNYLEKNIVYIPSIFEKEIIDFTYMKKKKIINDDNHFILHEIMKNVGINIPIEKKNNISLSYLKKVKSAFSFQKG